MIIFTTVLAMVSAASVSALDDEVRHIHNSTPSYCVSAETIRAQIADGFVPDERQREYGGPGWRVQQQHPDTALYATLKLIEDGGSNNVMCGYSSHVGVVYIRLFFTANIDPAQWCPTEDCGPGPYWRAEWTESAPEQDRPGSEMLLVCTRKDAAGVALPSRGCRFYLPPPEAPVPDVHGASGTTSETPPDDETPW